MIAANRNLLFGLLALQNDFITKQQLVDIFKAWTSDHSQSLTTMLVERNVLSEDDSILLSRLVDRHIEARGGDVVNCLRSLSGLESVREELELLADQDVTASISYLKPAARAAIANSTGPQSSEKRFEFLRPLASGGLGVVSVALDKELNREIALKEIRSDRADDEAYRSKFVLEAEVTGGLEHPGIVPVYGLGTGSDGRPYYAMRLVKGDDLLEHIKQFHKAVATGREPFDGTALRKLLRRFLDVCQAIEYAHSRGVLHRDLKPGNVMLGKYGETLVVDWGLAKPLGVHRPEASSNGNIAASEPSLVPSGSDERMTMEGSIVGTVAYAPPEQLSGNLDQVNQRSDVYGLGAMLYELLSGQPPIQGERIREVIKLALTGFIKAPRSIKPQIPKPLEAICLKAIKLQPKDRYATAAELGQEIERWLDDMPVHSYPEPALLKIKRWIRHHQALVATSLAVILMSMIGISLFAANATRMNSQLLLSIERESLEREKTERAQKMSESRLYASEISNAQQSLENDDFARATLFLDSCRWDLRGWEHDYLRSLCSKRESKIKSIVTNTSLRENKSLKDWNPTTSPTTLTLKGHASYVKGVAYSAEGQKIATVDNDICKVWDANTGKEISSWNYFLDAERMIVSDSDSSSVYFSPDGESVVTNGSLKTLKVWNVIDGAERLTLAGHKEEIEAFAFFPDGQRIVSAGGDYGKTFTVKIWNANSGQEISTISGKGSSVFSVAVSPDGKQIVTGNESTLTVRDVETLKELLTIKGHTGNIYSIAFSPDGRWIVSGSADSTIKIWDAANGKLVKEFDRLITTPVRSVAFNPSGSQVVSSYADSISGIGSGDTHIDLSEMKALILWDVSSGSEIAGLHGNMIGVSNVAFSPDGRKIVSSSNDFTARVWDMEAITENHRKQTNVFTGVNCLSHSPDGKSIASGSTSMIGNKGEIKLWDVETGDETLTMNSSSGGIDELFYTHDGKKIVTLSKQRVGNPGTICVWNIKTREKVLTLDSREKGRLDHHFPTGMCCMAISVDGSLVAGGDRKELNVWSLNSGNKQHTFDGAFVRAVAFHPNGRQMVTGSYQSIEVIDLPTSYRESKKIDGIGEIQSVAFSSDGSQVAVGGESGVVVWKGFSSDPVTTVPYVSRENVGTIENYQLPNMAIRGVSASVSKVSFSSDDKRVIAILDGETILWDVTSGQEMFRLRDRTSRASSVALSTNGRIIFTGHQDSTVQIHEIKTLPEFRAINTSGPVRCLSLTHDDKRIVGIVDSNIEYWDNVTGQELPIPITYATNISKCSATGEIVLAHDTGWRMLDAKTDAGLRILHEHGSTMEVFKPQEGGLIVSPDGMHIASGWKDGTIKIQNRNSGKIECSIKDYGWTNLTFSADSKLIAGGTTKTLGKSIVDSRFSIWDALTGEEKTSVRGGNSSVSYLAFSPIGLQIASGSLSGELHLWDGATGEHLKELVGHRDKIRSIAYSPDGKHIASGSADHSMKVWDAATGELKFNFPHFNGEVIGLMFSAEGRQLISSCEIKQRLGNNVVKDRGAILVWDLANVEKNLRK